MRTQGSEIPLGTE
uniref:Uncharacterized protein n=1 Tax=Nannospalax galili TaxID=1026970 RepID=A0A8C6R535_NANGA